MNIIEANGIKKGFPQPDGATFWALKGIDLTVPQGKLTILRGRSGSGKTTMMNILGALDPPTEGRVIFDGNDITDWGDQQRTLLRRKNIGCLQDMFHQDTGRKESAVAAVSDHLSFSDRKGPGIIHRGCKPRGTDIYGTIDFCRRFNALITLICV